jgi:hypothetical protein
MDGGDNGVFVLPFLCLLLYSLIAHSEGDNVVIITNIHEDRMARLGQGI